MTVRALAAFEAERHVENEAVTEDSAALAFAERYNGQLLFDHDAGSWFQWTGTHWCRERTGLAFHWARELARELALDQRSNQRLGLRKTTFASGVEKFCQRDRRFAVTSDDWDKNPFLFGTPGGTVDLRTGVLRQAQPRERITKTAGAAPATEADCPRWKAFLLEAMAGDQDLVDFLQQFAGYCLTGDTSEHALVFGYGSGGNGKSVFVNTLAGIVGDYAVTAPMDTLIAASGDRHPTDLAMLRGARLVTASETDEGRPWAESRLKQVTGGDEITARFMRQDFFTFRPSFKLVVIGNHKPALRTVDDATRRRFNIVPFTTKPAVPDRELETKLRAEWPGILRWMLDGCLAWQCSATGLTRPRSVLFATDEYFSAQDLVQQFLDDECDCTPAPDGTLRKAATGVLFQAWSKYALQAGEQPGSQKAFSDQIQRRGFELHKGAKGVRSVRGLSIKPAADPLSSFPAV